MKNRILEWSRKEIQRKGFRFTMSDLARQVGISTKTLYELYSSKDELIDDLLNLAIDELQSKEKEVVANASLNSIEKLQKLLVLLPVDFQYFHISRLEELQRYYPKQWKTLDRFINQQWEGVHILIQEGISKGLFRPFHIELFIELYVGGLYRLMEQSARSENQKTLSNALQDMVDILLLGIVKEKG
ncbi:TetR/AcrR family transcriptional regulator [Paenibacillus sp. GCM10027628]|uniref:TetR/AcrR family transcriptional regulator n=1 Tax=Paenibacillus sp. GCM10027628 TaxID=3273413 RepID=UPI00363E7AD9